jgi:hypothetical protein
MGFFKPNIKKMEKNRDVNGLLKLLNLMILKLDKMQQMLSRKWEIKQLLIYYLKHMIPIGT